MQFVEFRQQKIIMDAQATPYGVHDRYGSQLVLLVEGDGANRFTLRHSHFISRRRLTSFSEGCESSESRLSSLLYQKIPRYVV